MSCDTFNSTVYKKTMIKCTVNRFNYAMPRSRQTSSVDIGLTEYHITPAREGK